MNSANCPWKECRRWHDFVEKRPRSCLPRSWNRQHLSPRLIESLSFTYTYTVNSKRQTMVRFKLRISQNRERADKNSSDKKLRETANLWVEITNTRRQAKGKLVTWYKFTFTVWRKRDVKTSCGELCHGIATTTTSSNPSKLRNTVNFL